MFCAAALFLFSPSKRSGGMIPDIDSVTRILEETAAAEVLPRFRALEAEEVQSKGSGELVTVADLASERVLSERLAALLPGSLVVGEEAVEADPSLLERLSGTTPVWIIDPIDGTGNFARGEPVFVLMVGLVCRGETLAGWIHDPINHCTAVTERGAGAWMAGQRLSVAEGAAPQNMEGTLHASSFAPPDIAAQVRARRVRVKALKSMRCAGREYMRLASGEIQFSLFTRLMPWDHVPGTLLHREAGGAVYCLDHRPYSALRFRDMGLLMAPDEGSWQALYETIFGP